MKYINYVNYGTVISLIVGVTVFAFSEQERSAMFRFITNETQEIGLLKEEQIELQRSNDGHRKEISILEPRVMKLYNMVHINSFEWEMINQQIQAKQERIEYYQKELEGLVKEK